MKVIVHYCGYYVGTDLWDALGEYDSLEAADDDARSWAMEQHEQWAQDEEDSEEDSYFMQSCDYVIYEYVPEKHDTYRAGGGSFEKDFQTSKRFR